MPSSADKQQFNLSIPRKTLDQLEILAKKDLKYCPACGSELDERFNAGKYRGQKSTKLAAKILAETPELPEAIITHRFNLDGAPEAFEVARTRNEGAIKVALQV